MTVRLLEKFQSSMLFEKYKSYLIKVRSYGNHPGLLWDKKYNNYLIFLIPVNIFPFPARPEMLITCYNVSNSLAHQFDYCWVTYNEVLQQIDDIST